MPTETRSDASTSAQCAPADDVLQPPPDTGPRVASLTCRLSAIEKAAIAAVAEELGWSLTDVVVAGVQALTRPPRYLLSRYEANQVVQLLEQVRGAAANLNTVVRDFHTLRNRQTQGAVVDVAAIELALAEAARQIHDQLVQPCARLLGQRVPPLHLHPTRLAGHVPSTAERLRERRGRGGAARGLR